LITLQTKFNSVSEMKFLHGYKDNPYNNNKDRGIVRLNFDEAECLWRSIKATSGTILEIGRRHGGSTVLIVAAAGADRPVISVDIAPKHHQTSEKYFSDPEFSRSLKLIKDDAKNITTGNLGLLFIDGDHSYEGVKRDIDTHWDSLEIGGLCVFHDAVPNDGLKHRNQINHCPGVTTACQELVDGGKGQEVDSAGSVLVLKKLK